MKKRLAFLSLALLCLAASAWAQNRTTDVLKAGDTVKITAIEPGTTSLTVDTVSSGNALHMAVMQVPQLAATVVVGTDGKITVPKLGSVPADGLTVAELRLILEGRLTKYLNMPAVTVEVVK